MKKYHIIFAFLLTLICNAVFAQDETVKIGMVKTKRKINEIGFNAGYSFTGSHLPEGGYYKPLLLMLYYAHSFTKKEEAKSSFWFYFEPQVNPVSVNDKFTDWEYGINLGLKYSFAIVPRVLIYAAPGYGVYDISIQTARQRNGYIFGFNAPVGFYIKLNNKIAINLQYRWRHISNGMLKRPNKGLQGYIGVVGISWFLGRYKTIQKF